VVSDAASDQPTAEIERLRAEVEALREQGTPRRQGWWRPVLATVLIVILAVLTPLGVVARWAHNEVSDTDRYVESVSSLATDPAVQRAVADRITTEITSRLEIEAVTQQAVEALSARGLPPRASASLTALSGPLVNAIEGFIHTQVTRLVESKEFAQAWDEANRQAHTQMVALLTGKDQGAVEVNGNAVQLNLAVLINTVKERLVAQGFQLAERLPEVQAEFTLFQSSDLTKAQNGFRFLSSLNTLLPILALLCLLGAVAVGRSRRRTLIAGTLAIAASMLLLGVALNAFRMVYLDAVPSDQLPPDAAAAIYDTLAWFIRLNLRALLVLSLAVAFIAWVSGPSGASVAVRRGTNRVIGTVRHGSERAGVDTGRLGVALDTYRTAIRGVVLGAGLLVYVMADHPTGKFTIILLLVSAAVLLVVELLARPAAAAAEPS
jgi:hypothetical protein